MDGLLAKAGKVAVGIAGALIVGELTAIGANAADPHHEPDNSCHVPPD